MSSSPAVADGTVVAVTSGGRILAVDAATGDEEWTREAQAAPYSMPAIAGDNVYVGTDAGTVISIDLESGDERWSYDAGAAVAGALPSLASRCTSVRMTPRSMRSTRSPARGAGRARWSAGWSERQQWAANWCTQSCSVDRTPRSWRWRPLTALNADGLNPRMLPASNRSSLRALRCMSLIGPASPTRSTRLAVQSARRSPGQRDRRRPRTRGWAPLHRRV